MCCSRFCQSPLALVCLTGGLVLMAIACVVAAELVLPAMIIGNVHSLVVMDSQSKFDKLFKDKPIMNRLETVFFNLTNAHELQTVSPAPKPIFKEVRVPFDVELHSLDYELSADEMTYKHKLWVKQRFVNDADKSLAIVQVNPSLLTLLMFLGGEAGLRGISQAAAASDVQTACGAFPAAILPYCFLAPTAYQTLLDEQALGLSPDGTGKKNAGLFTKRTVDELVNGGYTDELLGLPQFGPLMGSNAHASPEAFLAAVAAGFQPDGPRFEYVRYTGKGNISQAGMLVSKATFTELSFTNNNPLYLMPATGYDNAGSTALTAGPFVITGKRDASIPLAARTSAPNVWQAGVPPKISTTGGESFTFLDDLYLWREAKLSSPVPDDLHGTRLQKYFFDDSNGWLTVGGVRDELGACAATMSCDFGQVFENVWARPGFPLAAISRPYFGKSSALLTNGYEFLSADGTTTMAYDDDTMKTSLSIEPFSGVAAKSEYFFQVNYQGVSSMFFDTQSANALYANVFSGSLPPVWPNQIAVARIGFGTEPTSEQKLAAVLFPALYATMLFLHVVAVLLVVASVLTFRRARKMTGRAKVQESPTKKQPLKGSAGLEA